MNDGMYIAFRSYLEEHSSLLRQLLDEQKRTNEMLQAAANKKAEPGTFTIVDGSAATAKATTPPAKPIGAARKSK